MRYITLDNHGQQRTVNLMNYLVNRTKWLFSKEAVFALLRGRFEVRVLVGAPIKSNSYDGFLDLIYISELDPQAKNNWRNEESGNRHG